MLVGIEGRIFNLDFDKGFEMLDLTMEGGYSALSRIKGLLPKSLESTMS
jgi:hypothetical protein